MTHAAQRIDFEHFEGPAQPFICEPAAFPASRFEKGHVVWNRHGTAHSGPPKVLENLGMAAAARFRSHVGDRGSRVPGGRRQRLANRKTSEAEDGRTANDGRVCPLHSSKSTALVPLP